MSVVRTVDEKVDIFDVAARYDLGWGASTGRPQQVHCPMHNDSSPSARVYPESNSGYCWTCQEAFGPSRLVADAESIHIVRAAHLLAARLGIDTRPDADLSEFRQMADRWEAGPSSDTPEARRAAGLAVRAPRVPWATVEALLPVWDALDAGTVKPADFLDLVRSIPSTIES